MMRYATTREFLALLFAAVFPTLLTWVYFVALNDFNSSPALRQAVYLVGKTLQFAFPLIWVWRAGKPAPLGFLKFQGVLWGLGLGLVVAFHGLVIYFGWLADLEAVAAAGETLRNKLGLMQITSVGRYLGLAAAYIVVHSFLEEYYFRWFLFGRMKELIGTAGAAWVSSLCFAAHHVVLLASYFGWTSPWTWLLAAAVAVGGYLWAALYERTSSITASWVSHLVVDAMIFTIGLHLAWPLFSGR